MLLVVFVHCESYSYIFRRPNCPQCTTPVNRRALVRLFFNGYGDATSTVVAASKGAKRPNKNVDSSAGIRHRCVRGAAAKISRRRSPIIAGTDNVASGARVAAATAGAPTQAKITRRRMSTMPFNMKSKTCLLCNKRFVSAEVDELCDNCRHQFH